MVFIQHRPGKSKKKDTVGQQTVGSRLPVYDKRAKRLMTNIATKPIHIKNDLSFCNERPLLQFFGNGAQKRTRTSTPLTGLAPETSASTNFAIWARKVRYTTQNRLSRYFFSKICKKCFDFIRKCFKLNAMQYLNEE